MTIEVSGITDKIFSVGNKLAPLAGVYQGFFTNPMADANGDFGTALQNIYHRVFVQERSLGRGHFGNPLITTQLALAQPERFPILSGATMAVTGWIAEMLGKSFDAGKIGGVITKFGHIMKNYGSAAAISGVVAGWLYLTPYNPGEGAGFSAHGTGSTTITTSPQMSFNVGGPNAPHASSTNGYRTQLGNFESVVA